MSQKYETKASIIHTNEVLIAPPQVAGAINQLTKNTGGTFPTGFYSGQTFLIGSSPFKVNSVDVYLVSTAARTGNHTVEIWATDSDTPDNSSIIAVSENVSGASIPVNGTANATTAQAVTFVFSSPPTLNPATKYAIVWKNTTDGSVFVARASGNLYTDGRYGFAQSPYNLAAWTPNMNATEDMTFAILGTEVSDRVFFGAPSGSILDFTELSEIDFTGVTLTGLSSSGANATLSNLDSPTSINQDLLPSSSFLRSLGSTSRVWQFGHIQTLAGSSLPIAIHIGNRQLIDPSNNPALVWSSGLVSHKTLTPNATGTLDLGATSLRWNNVYTNTLSLGGNILPNANQSREVGQAGGGQMLRGYFREFWWYNSAASRTGITTGNAATLPSGASRQMIFQSDSTNSIGVFTPSTSASGHLNIETGNASSGDSGDIVLYIGTATGTRGKLKFVDGTEGTVGHVWTQTNADGSGAWQAAAGGGANTNLSNLDSPTSINQHLTPDAMANNRTLGRPGNSSTNPKWSALYLQNAGIALVIQDSNISEALNIGSAISLPNSAISGTGLRSPLTLNIVMNTAQRTAQNSGSFAVETGNYAGTTVGQRSGEVLLRTGNATATDGSSGGITLQTGTVVSGTRGTINLIEESLGSASVGYVWTLQNTSTGAGSWAAAGSGGANTTLSNLTSPTAINQNLLFDTSDTYDLGSTTSRVKQVTARTYRAFGNSGLNTGNFAVFDTTGVAYASYIGNQTLPSGVTGAAGIRNASGLADTSAMAIWTVNDAVNDSVKTRNVRIETGNKTAGTGNSGDITLQTGTSAGGTRGRIELLASTIGHNQVVSEDVVWQSGVTGSRPGSPVLGQRFFDTTLGIPIWYNGTNWVDATGATV